MRKCNRSLKPWALLFAATSAVSLPALAQADTPIVQFTPGDYLLMRGGDPTNPNNAGAPDFDGEVDAYIDEYSQSGYYVGTLNLPQVTLPGGGGNSLHEGNLNISPNGQWIAFAGYDASTDGPGSAASPVGPTEHPQDGTESAIIGEVNLPSGPSSLNTSTIIQGSSSFPNNLTGQFVRSALTLDGNEFYIGGKYNETSGGNLQTNDTGLLYVNGTGPTATTTVLEGGTDWRNILVFNGQLYGATGSSSVGAHGAYSIGTGVPTSNTPIPDHTNITNYSGGQSASSLAFIDVQTSDSSAGTSNGFNVLYTVGDQSVPGITKYYFDAATQEWNFAAIQAPLNGNNVSIPFDVVATVDPTNPAWVDLAVSGLNGIYTYIDKNGDPKSGLSANSFTQLITPPGYASFYGMTQIPGQANFVWGNSGNGQTWDVGVSSNWTYAGSNVKFANQQNVTFDDTSNNTQPIILNSVVQPSSVTVEASKNNFTITGTGSIGGSAPLRLLPGNTSTFTLDTANTYTGGTIVEGGTLIAGVNNAIPSNTSLTIAASSTVRLATGTGLATLSSLAIAANGVLDITNNHIIVNYSPGTQLIADSTVLGYLTSGRNGGAWTGTNGIISSGSSGTGVAPGYSIGYADGADKIVTGLSSGQIEVKYTLLGDANLDGLVTGDDFTILVGNLGKSGISQWDKGNFLYSPSGSITGDDFTALVGNLGKSASGADVAIPAADYAAIDAFAAANGLMADVPEPASVGILSAAACGLLLRRRRA